MDYGYDHPERYQRDLVFMPDGKIPEKVLESRKGLLSQHSNHHEDTELCRACGWNSSHELYAGYDPRVKIFHARNNIGLWQIGRRWMLRDQPNDGTLGNDYMTQQFLRGQPNLEAIPLVKEMRLLSEPDDQIQFTLMSQAQGERLDDLWHTLTRDQKSEYTFQLAEIIKNLRQLHAPTARKVNGDRLDDMVVAECIGVHAPTCKKIGATNDEWFDGMAPELRHGLAKIYRTRDPDVIEEKLKELKDNFPSSEPYVLTHGDLNLSNVIVKDGKIEAVIDWEMAGFHPWWVERQRMGFQWPVSGDDDLFEAAWEHIQPGMTTAILQKQVYPRIQAVRRAWEACAIDHPNLQTGWLRPDFCECKPFAGSLNWIDIGRVPGHEIRHFDPALMTQKTTATTKETPSS